MLLTTELEQDVERISMTKRSAFTHVWAARIATLLHLDKNEAYLTAMLATEGRYLSTRNGCMLSIGHNDLVV